MYVNSSSDHLLKKTLMIHFEGFETLWRSLLKLFKYRYLNQHSTKFNFNFIWLQKAVFMWILLTMGCQSYTISSTLSLVWNVFWINVLKTPPDFLPASRRLPAGPAFPIYWLASVQRHAAVQTLYSAAGQTTGQVAGAVWRRRWTHGGPLSVSVTSSITTQLFYRNMLMYERLSLVWRNPVMSRFDWTLLTET